MQAQKAVADSGFYVHVHWRGNVCRPACSGGYLFLELAMTPFCSSWEGVVPFTDALGKVELITPHSCLLRFKGPCQLPLHVVQVAVDPDTACSRFHRPSAVRAACLQVLSAVPVKAAVA